jgi:hypothetical protein
MNGDASGNYTVGNSNGAVTVTASGDDYKVSPTTGAALDVVQTNVTSFVINSVTMNAAAVVIDGETVTGAGDINVTALEGDAAADLSNITSSGTKTIAVDGDVTFTGSLGSGFTTSVASGATLTADVAKLQNQTIDGAGTVAITDLDTDLDAVLSTITATSVTAAFNLDGTFTGNLGTAVTTVASGKTLTADHAVLAGETISGGSVTVTGDIDTDTDLTNISSTIDLNEADVAISTGKTLTIDAISAVGETFSGAGTLAVTASAGAQVLGLGSTTTTPAILTVATGDGDDIVTVGDMVNITVADSFNLGGGTGDVLKLMADNDSTGAVFDEAGHVGVETVSVLASTTAATENAILTLTYASAYDQDMIIDASAMSNASANFTLAVTTAGNVDGDLTVKASAGANVLASGDGNDTFVMGAITTVTAADSVAAGTGSADVMQVTADDSGTGGVLDAAGAVGIETVSVLASSTATENAVLTLTYGSAHDQNMIIDASAMSNAGADFTLAVTTAGNVDGDLTVKASAGANVLAAGDGADIFEFGALANVTAGDSVDGGGGADTIKVTADNDATGAVFDNAGHANVEKIVIAAGSTASHDANITLTYSGAYTDALEIDASALTDTGAVFTLAQTTVAHVDQALTVKGGAGKDVILGGDGADTITGNGSADTIDIDAGASKVYFTFTDAATAATEAGSTAGTDNDFSAGTIGDKVSNFTTGTDFIYAKAAALTNVGGSSADTLKSINGSGTVADTDRFVEVTAAAGDGTMGAAITLLNGLTTSAVEIGDSFLAFVHDSSNGFLYVVEQVSAADTIAAQDVTLLAQITGVTDVANGDFVSYA